MKKRLMSVISVVLFAVILFANCLNSNNSIVEIMDTEIPLAANEDVYGMLKFDNWQKGDYNYQTGKYYTNESRICLIECPTVVGGQKFEVNINQNNVHLLIREMNSEGKVVVSRDLTSGKNFETNANTTSIRIAMYVKSSAVKMTYDEYKNLFDSGLEAYLTTDRVDDAVDEENQVIDGEEDNVTDVEEDNVTDIEDDKVIDNNDVFGMLDFANWRTGNYSISGNYCLSPTRICLNDYVNVVSGQTYVINISDSKFHILLRELDSNNKFIKSYDLVDKDTYTVSGSCSKIGISIYDTKQKTKNFDMYESLFQNGFKATLELDSNVQDDIVIEDDIPIYGSSSDENSTSDNNEVVYPDVKSEIIAMIQNGDTTTHDVSKYHMKWLDVNSIFNSVVKNECLLEFECAYGIWISFETDGDYAKAIKLNGIDSTYADCLAKSKERIANVMAGIDDSMTDLDKALYCYDNLVINSKYSKANSSCYYGGNVLAYNTGACTGISSAYMLLLREAGIESTKVASSSMNHSWIMIKIEGKWYHADPTWDNTRYRYSKVVSRHYFMRNDAEYNSSLLLKKHYSWSVTGGYSSTSTTYSDWIVHDITVPMTYKDGYWYYTDSKTGNSMKIKLD